MVLGRLIHFFIPSHTLFSIPASTLAVGFVSLDFVSFVIQLIGGSWAGPTAPEAKQLQGVHIYMGGIGLQQCFICIFVGLAIRFQREMMEIERLGMPSRGNWRPLLYALYTTLGLITVCTLWMPPTLALWLSLKLCTPAGPYIFPSDPVFLRDHAFEPLGILRSLFLHP